MDALSLFFPAHVTLALSFYLFLWLLPFFLQSFLPFRISVILSGTSLFPLSFPAILVSPRCLFLALSHFCLKLLLVLPLSSIYMPSCHNRPLATCYSFFSLPSSFCASGQQEQNIKSSKPQPSRDLVLISSLKPSFPEEAKLNNWKWLFGQDKKLSYSSAIADYYH